MKNPFSIFKLWKILKNPIESQRIPWRIPSASSNYEKSSKIPENPIESREESIEHMKNSKESHRKWMQQFASCCCRRCCRRCCLGGCNRPCGFSQHRWRLTGGVVGLRWKPGNLATAHTKAKQCVGKSNRTHVPPCPTPLMSPSKHPLVSVSVCVSVCVCQCVCRMAGPCITPDSLKSFPDRGGGSFQG